MTKKHKDYFKDMRSFALGTATTGVSFGVAGAAGSMSPVKVTGGLSTMASFTPIMGTMVGAKSTMKMFKKKKGGSNGL